MSEHEEPEDKPANSAEDALARARESLDRIPDPATSTEEVAATDAREAPLADPEAAPEPVYPKEPETAPRDRPVRSAADVARAIEGAPPKLAVFADVPRPSAPKPAATRPTWLGDTTSPVDLPEPLVPLPNPLGWTTALIAVATLFLALFNAQTIRSWAYQLPPSETSARIAEAAEAWYGVTASIGLDRPYALLHGWYGEAKEARFQDAPANTAEPQ